MNGASTSTASSRMRRYTSSVMRSTSGVLSTSVVTAASTDGARYVPIDGAALSPIAARRDSNSLRSARRGPHTRSRRSAATSPRARRCRPAIATNGSNAGCASRAPGTTHCHGASGAHDPRHLAECARCGRRRTSAPSGRATVSNDPSSNGSDAASPCRHSMSGRTRPATVSIASLRSRPTTVPGRRRRGRRRYGRRSPYRRRRRARSARVPRPRPRRGSAPTGRRSRARRPSRRARRPRSGSGTTRWDRQSDVIGDRCAPPGRRASVEHDPLIVRIRVHGLPGRRPWRQRRRPPPRRGCAG